MPSTAPLHWVFLTASIFCREGVLQWWQVKWIQAFCPLGKDSLFLSHSDLPELWSHSIAISRPMEIVLFGIKWFFRQLLLTKHCSSGKQLSSEQLLTSHKLMVEAHVSTRSWCTFLLFQIPRAQNTQNSLKFSTFPLSRNYFEEQSWHQKPIWGEFSTKALLRERTHWESPTACQR